MAAPSRGAQHYILLLIPNLLHDIERLGLKHIIAHSDLPEQDVTSLYFEGKSISQLLPDDPARIDPAIWDDLVHCVRIMRILLNEAAGDELARKRRRAINRFLPQARQSIQCEFEKRRKQGKVDFRLAGIARTQVGEGRAEETCMEALRLERQQRFETMMTTTVAGLNWHQAVIVQSAKAYVQQQMADPPAGSGAVDLVISLMDLLRQLQSPDEASELETQTAPPGVGIETVVMGLGNILYRRELGLDVQGQNCSQRVG